MCLALVVAVVAAASPASAHAAGARLSGIFAMAGRITVADNVYGERGGQRVHRRWRFRSSCPRGACARVILYRERSHRRVDRIVLRRHGTNFYVGRGSFPVPLRCDGRDYQRGGLAIETITVRVRHARAVGNERFATAVDATYDNPARYNQTLCSGFIGHDAARYSGHATVVPGPPSPSFSVTATPGTTSATFTDRSRPGAGGARIVSWRWSFGDPASGQANESTSRDPAHTFSAHGTYTVTLTVTDANGVSATASQQVTV